MAISANAQWSVVSTQNVGLSGRLHAYNSTLFLYGAFSGFHVYKSVDEGASWTDMISSFPYDVYYMYNFNNQIFALTGQAGKIIYASSDGGVTWSQKSSFQTVTGNGGLVWMTSDGNKLYAVSNRKSFYTSINDGLNWTETIISNAAGNMSCFAAAGNTMVSVIVGVGAMVSIDGGQTWAINNPTNPALTITYVINFNNSVYGISSGSGVFKFNASTNTWESLSIGLPDALSFQISKAFLKQANALYIATIGFLDSKVSIFKSTDNGLLWTPYTTTGLPILNAATSSTSVAFTTQNMFLYDSKNNIATLYKIANSATKLQSVSNQNTSLFELNQNFPNPFSSITNISFNLTKSMHVKLKVYDINAKEMLTLVDEMKPVGAYNIACNMNGFTKGIYFYKLEAGQFLETKSMILK